MYRNELERIGMLKFFRVLFDLQRAWANHIRRVEENAKKVINVIGFLAGREWGENCVPLKRVYAALIRPVLDNGSLAYGSAVKSLISKLETIQV